MPAYYNENDPYAAQWLRNLIAAGHIAPGIVDDRSILEVRPADLAGFDQCHFFAGIGVWSYALRCAGWADDRPIWSGSCPCQPFSAAGAGNEFADERHLWPAWFALIRECKPVAIFGEQVASRDALAWLDHVCADLEATGYAVGAVDSCAAGYGAPHIRQRLYWVADANIERTESRQRDSGRTGPGQWEMLGGYSVSSVVADAEGMRPEGNGRASTWEGQRGIDQRGATNGRPRGTSSARSADTVGERGNVGGPTNGFWSDALWLPCRDGKARPTQPGIFPLAHGATQRVGRLRAYGNAICAPQATEFVRAYMTL